MSCSAIFLLEALRIKPGTFHMPGKLTTTELYPKSFLFFNGVSINCRAGLELVNKTLNL